MNHLPIDILQEIFLFLHQIDKVECMLVCRYWKQIIEEFALYHTIVLRQRSSRNMLMKKIREKPEIGKKIHHFFILKDELNIDRINLIKLLSLLPNLRVLFSFISSLRDGYSNQVLDEELQYSWHDSIQYFYEYNALEPKILQLLSSRTCPNLSTIILHLDENREVLPLLQNAPALKVATFHGGKINFNDLDILHDNLPCLNTLTLHKTYIENTGFNENINHPARTVSRCYLSCESTQDLQSVINWLVYISKKYPNLSLMRISGRFTNMNNEHLEKLYTHGWVPFCQNIGSRLKDLRLDVVEGHDTSDFFSTMDKYNCQLSHFIHFDRHPDIIRVLAHSHQINYIQTLELASIEDHQDYEWLNKFHLLKELKLSGLNSRGFLDIKDIIFYAPSTLKSLTIRDYHTVIYPKDTIESQIETLSFTLNEFPEAIDTFINQHFPKLSRLELSSDFGLKEKTWNMPALDLYTFQFVNVVMKKNYTFLVKTYSNNELRLYTPRDNFYRKDELMVDSFYNRPFKSYPVCKVDMKPFFTLCCNSLKNICF